VTGQAIKFCFVGALVFGVDFAALWACKPFLPRLLAVSIAYFVAVILHFCLNKWWVFGTRRSLHGMEVARYVLTVLICWLCTITVVAATLKLATDNVFIAKAFAIPPTTALSFVLMRSFVFR
jgi:putative flippase GtrA